MPGSVSADHYEAFMRSSYAPLIGWKSISIGEPSVARTPAPMTDVDAFVIDRNGRRRRVAYIISMHNGKPSVMHALVYAPESPTPS